MPKAEESTMFVDTIGFRLFFVFSAIILAFALHKYNAEMFRTTSAILSAAFILLKFFEFCIPKTVSRY
jgi:hypothetical protein